MNDELLEKLNDIGNDLNNSLEIKELIKIKNIIMNDKELLEKIKKLQNMDINDKEYMTLKKELFDNDNYKKYKELENKVYYFSLEASKKLKELRGEHENN